MQSAFFYLAGVMPYEEANKHMKEFVVKSFSKKGEAVVNMNFAAIDDAVSGLVEVKYPESWKDATTGAEVKPVTDDPYYKAFVEPMLAQKGDSLPVSEIEADGHVPTATTRFEKRGVAVNVPSWISENCIQCNQCAFVCPHAAIRPVFLKTPPKPSLRRTRRALRASNTECRFPLLTVPVAEAARTFAPQR